MAAILTNGLSAKGWGSRAARPPSLPHRQIDEIEFGAAHMRWDGDDPDDPP